MPSQSAVTPVSIASPVPTNIISGFLGVGKSTALLYQISAKPPAERWAILVNEFGEIGIDGSLIQGQYGESAGIYIREVPGGCMCCAAGLPMHMALHQLLHRARPDRLLIEPTGLGHPREVLELLRSDAYNTRLTINKSITLVDARKLDQAVYADNPTFREQIEVADIVVGNKQDLYREEHVAGLKSYVAGLMQPTATLMFTSQGIIDPALLDSPSTVARLLAGGVAVDHAGDEQPDELQLPETGYLRAENAADGYQTVGWRFSPAATFRHSRLLDWLRSLRVLRAKAIFITDHGVLGYNLADDVLQEIQLDEAAESRIEIIASAVEEDWESQLLACRADSPDTQ